MSQDDSEAGGKALVSLGNSEKVIAAGQDEPLDETPDIGADPVRRILLEAMQKLGLKVEGDRVLRPVGRRVLAKNPAELKEVMKQEQYNERYLLDHASDSNIPRSGLMKALRQIGDHYGPLRKVDILRPLMFGQMIGESAAEWMRLSTLFETNSEIVIAGFQHYIWQIKRKATNAPVTHHMMPLVMSPIQGVGKTEFVLRMLAPLHELAAGPYSILDFADVRSNEIYESLAVFFDDMEAVPRNQLPRLKQLITAEEVGARQLGTGKTKQTKQRATLIGTANHSISELIPDPTGSRRFLELRFRNGNVDKGGDPDVWPTVNSLNYPLLWLSVDHLKDSPIKGFLKSVYEHQQSGQPAGQVKQFLVTLDVNSPEVQRIRVTHGARAHELFELFVETTGSTMSEKLFATCMDVHSQDPDIPFGPRKRANYGAFYSIKPGKLTA